MGLVIQMQRRAIEVVFDKLDLRIGSGSGFILNGSNLDLLGISDGTGTCSDIKGIDIAVFSLDFPFNPKHHRPLKFPISCGGAILLRNLTPEEIEKNKSVLSNSSLCAVEGLRLSKPPANNIYNFHSNNRSTTYVALA